MQCLGSQLLLHLKNNLYLFISSTPNLRHLNLCSDACLWDRNTKLHQTHAYKCPDSLKKEGDNKDSNTLFILCIAYTDYEK